MVSSGSAGESPPSWPEFLSYGDSFFTRPCMQVERTFFLCFFFVHVSRSLSSFAPPGTKRKTSAMKVEGVHDSHMFTETQQESAYTCWDA